MLPAFSLGTLLGAQFKEAWYAESPASASAAATRLSPKRAKAARRKRQCYSGLFVLLKLNLRWPARRVQQLVRQTLHPFHNLLFPPVPTFV